MKINLVLQSFGRENEYKRAILTILSFYAHVSVPLSNTRTILFTDAPNKFTNFLEGLPIDYILLTADKVKEMRGEIDFLHRIKIAVIEEAFNITSGNILYADSDTFFTADPTPLMLDLCTSKSFMHEWEYHFEIMQNWGLPAGQSFRDFYNLIRTRNFRLVDGSTISISPKHSSWNAGVMMFHESHAQFIPDVYELTNQFYPASKNHASEQYAFSVILQERTLVAPCDSVIYHYWYRIKKHIIDDFLSIELNENLAAKSMFDKFKIIRGWTVMLPKYFGKHLWMIRDSAIQSFNENRFADGYKWAVKAMIKNPSDLKFLKNVIYHTKRFFLG